MAKNKLSGVAKKQKLQTEPRRSDRARLPPLPADQRAVYLDDGQGNLRFAGVETYDGKAVSFEAHQDGTYSSQSSLNNGSSSSKTALMTNGKSRKFHSDNFALDTVPKKSKGRPRKDQTAVKKIVDENIRQGMRAETVAGVILTKAGNAGKQDGKRVESKTAQVVRKVKSHCRAETGQFARAPNASQGKKEEFRDAAKTTPKKRAGTEVIPVFDAEKLRAHVEGRAAKALALTALCTIGRNPVRPRIPKKPTDRSHSAKPTKPPIVSVRADTPIPEVRGSVAENPPATKKVEKVAKPQPETKHRDVTKKRKEKPDSAQRLKKTKKDRKKTKSPAKSHCLVEQTADDAVDINLVSFVANEPSGEAYYTAAGELARPTDKVQYCKLIKMAASESGIVLVKAGHRKGGTNCSTDAHMMMFVHAGEAMVHTAENIVGDLSSFLVKKAGVFTVAPGRWYDVEAVGGENLELFWVRVGKMTAPLA
ncbi:uncharacterized protein LOC129590014 [Paramacrobiotus metropolitanus]|uniref:uncharacterized protein LOC129590014 n=1 Tax=Paramacrobiotus metropolitanus TaxID=2943436 RepID=UPI002446109F|nr:uncharacterized protein LOC129590014 [Paramacrobiotus metropolitanus]